MYASLDSPQTCIYPIVMANGSLIAPCGTHMVAMAAKKHNVPVVVCCGIYKLTPQYPLDQFSFNERLNPSQIIPYEDGDYLDNVLVVNPAFDYVPQDLIDLFVTNVYVKLNVLRRSLTLCTNLLPPFLGTEEHITQHIFIAYWPSITIHRITFWVKHKQVNKTEQLACLLGPSVL